jgi:hypothetical protein
LATSRTVTANKIMNLAKVQEIPRDEGGIALGELVVDART